MVSEEDEVWGRGWSGGGRAVDRWISLFLSFLRSRMEGVGPFSSLVMWVVGKRAGCDEVFAGVRISPLRDD